MDPLAFPRPIRSPSLRLPGGVLVAAGFLAAAAVSGAWSGSGPALRQARAAAPAASTTVQLDGGGAHTVGTLPSFTVWGANLTGQLCRPDPSPQPTPLWFRRIPAVKAVAGERHSLALLNRGTVRACGDNTYGQLGDGTLNDSSTPVQASGLSNIVDIEDGARHSLARSADGAVFVWGDNAKAQLCAPPSGVPQTTPMPVNLDDVQAFAGGDHHSVFLRNGQVFGCGSNLYGQLGLGSGVQGVDAPTPVPGVSGVQAVAAGGEHTAMIVDDGAGGTRLVTMGRNAHGQLCLGDTDPRSSPAPTGITNAVAVSAEGPFTAVLLDDGRVITCGWQMFGETDGGAPKEITGIPPIQVISAGHYHLHMIDVNGGIWAMGENFLFQLGDGTNVTRTAPVLIGNIPG